MVHLARHVPQVRWVSRTDLPRVHRDDLVVVSSGMRITTTLLLVVLAAAGCKDEPKKSADEGRKEKADDDDGDKSEKKDAEETKAEDGVVPPPEKGDVPELKVGAWTKYHILGKDGEKQGEGRWALLEKRNDDEYLVEADVNLQLPLVAQAWIQVKDLRDPEGIKLKEMKAKIGGQVRTFPAGGNSPASAMFDRFLGKTFVPKFEGLPQEDVEVPAGTFKGCYRWENTTTMFGMTVTSTIWTHPAIPLPSMAKNESKDSTWVLVDYGMEGAESSM